MGVLQKQVSENGNRPKSTRRPVTPIYILLPKSEILLDDLERRADVVREANRNADTIYISHAQTFLSKIAGRGALGGVALAKASGRIVASSGSVRG